jgi:general secretion pathway protein I
MKLWQPLAGTGKNTKGFTLIEMMIALTILALVVAAVAHALSQGLALAHRIKKETTLSLLAQSKMAEIESARVTAGSGRGNFSGNFSQYSWQVTVSESGIPSLKKVEVTVMDTLAEKSAGFHLSSFQCKDETS